MKTIPPTRKVIRTGTVYGYRGYPSVYIELECGHTLWKRGDYTTKLKAGKSKCRCRECKSKIKTENENNVHQ